ncbi:hypothetical protein VTO42DRAFT_8915 [Malbranchea cinnamomea]
MGLWCIIQQVMGLSGRSVLSTRAHNVEGSTLSDCSPALRTKRQLAPTPPILRFDLSGSESSGMAPPRRKVLATAEETLTPPDELAEGQLIAKVIRATGNNIYSVELPSKESMLVELPSKFRSTIWMKRGSFVLVDTNALEARENKLAGQIINIVRDEKAWRKAPYWPREFVKQRLPGSDDEESTVGKLPASDDESDA